MAKTTPRATCYICGVSRENAKFTHPSYCRDCWNVRQKANRDGSIKVSPRPCRQCGVVYTPKQAAESWYCSRACKHTAKVERLKVEHAIARPERECPQCGRLVSQFRRVDAKFCSDACSQASHDGLRTSPFRKRQIHRDLLARDGDRCGICRKRVNMSLAWPDPMSPSMDHIVPVADGGSDEMANLRLTHLGCNCRRRRGEGVAEQLAIL